MLSIPIVGNIRNGTGAKIFNADSKLSFFNISVIKDDPKNKKSENIAPKMKKILVILFTKDKPSSFETRGKK